LHVNAAKGGKEGPDVEEIAKEGGKRGGSNLLPGGGKKKGTRNATYSALRNGEGKTKKTEP